MTLAVVFRRAARAEFIEAASRYEAKKPGLGQDFIAEIERCIALAADHPGMYPTIHRNLRRIPARRFPYGVYFAAEPQRIVVIAVFHVRRDPAVWHGRN